MGQVTNERFRTGNRVFVMSRGPGQREILGKGFAGGRIPEGTQTSMNTNLATRPVHTIGDELPQDVVRGATTFQVRLGTLQLVSREAADRINADTVDIDYVDRFTGKVIKTAEECHLSGDSLDVSANNLVQQNINFECMRIR